MNILEKFYPNKYLIKCELKDNIFLINIIYNYIYN